jgi:hypothetical protein
MGGVRRVARPVTDKQGAVLAKPGRQMKPRLLWRQNQTQSLVLRPACSSSCLSCLIIQTVRRDPSGSDQIDEASNLSRPDRSGAVQIDVEHQPTDLAVGGSNLSRRAPSAQVSDLGCLFCLP